jgi:type IV secretory pathway VirJ component
MIMLRFSRSRQPRLAAILTVCLIAGSSRALAQSPVASRQSSVTSQPETAAAPAFGTVTIYRPAVSPQHVVLLLSGGRGWDAMSAGMAERLREAGALVVGIDTRSLIRTMDESGGCGYPASDLEELSRAIQLRYKLPTYSRPILVGYGSGAALVYAAIAAAPPETFAGALSLGFCPELSLKDPLCELRGLVSPRIPGRAVYGLSPFTRSTVPWIVLQGGLDEVCRPTTTARFVAGTGAARLVTLPHVGHGFSTPARWTSQFLDAYRAVANARPVREAGVSTTPAVADLSPVEVPARVGTNADMLAIVLSGDGGWADIDKNLAASLAAKGIPVVGWSSLTYYWTPRTPEGAAADLARLIAHYTNAWGKQHVIIVGYSFGADVTPFLVNRLPAAARNRISRVALLSPSDNAVFEFHLASWFGGGADPRNPTRSEIEKLSVPVVCVAATDEAHSVCRQITIPQLRLVTIGQGHHFSGEYARVADAILQ